MKHLVCYSGGHSSALVAIEVTRKYGAENVILLNHDINLEVEDADIKRFKNEIADYLGIKITYANMDGWEGKDQFDVCVDAAAFKVGSGSALCTNRLKTQPFDKYLQEHFPNGEGVVIYYGFDENEVNRIQRRSQILGVRGYQTDYPLAYWNRTIQRTEEIGIRPPGTYGTFKHANCIGCLKAGKQHWYIVYVTRPDVWQKAKEAETIIGHTIFRDVSLDELEPIFEEMEQKGVPASEHVPSHKFWKMAKETNKQLSLFDDSTFPCECLL